MYLGSGLWGFAVSLQSLWCLPAAALVLFLAGTGLYLLQLMIFIKQKPNWAPELIGFRGVQHIIVLAGSATHLYTASVYL
jgi:predicted membrane channel-forming protein YqfA (hemolysin III family)